VKPGEFVAKHVKMYGMIDEIPIFHDYGDRIFGMM
jgi:hypothetical protein